MIKRTLSNPIIQHLSYATALLLWTWLFWDTFEKGLQFQKTSIGLNYATIYSLPAALLFMQSLRNNKILWLLIFVIYSISCATTFFSVISGIIERRGNHVKAIDWTLNEILLLILILTIIAGINWLIFQMKPKRII